LAAVGPLIEDDLFHDEPKDLLALDHARRIPQFGKILTQRDNLSAVRRGMRRGDQGEKPYCLTGECSRDVKCCLTKRAPVASPILRPSRSSFSNL
jgi:hypothetical protein